MGDLDSDTAIVEHDGRLSCVLQEHWQIVGPFGGYVAAVALRAAATGVADGLEPASFTCQFLAPARFERVDIDVTVRRASTRTALVAVGIHQDGTDILDAQAWFSAPSDLLEHDAARNVHGHPDDYETLSAARDGPQPHFFANFERRPIDWITNWSAHVASAPEHGEWLRFVPTAEFDDPVLEACRLVMMADLPSYPAGSRAHDGGLPTVVAPSLDLAVQFLRVHDLGEWLLSYGVAPVAHRGLMGYRAEVWNAAGQLVATGGGQLLSRPLPRRGGT
jgi:acyl-CoA thioesterase